MTGGLAGKRANAPALGGKGLGGRRGPMMKLPTSSGPDANAVDPQQNAFKKYADVV